MVKKTNIEEVIGKVAREGVTRKVFSGERCMMVINTIEPFARPALHKHPHEQITYILAGNCNFTIGEEEVPMGPQDVILIPPEVPHTLTPLGKERIINLDVFSPIREDYL